MIHGHTNTNSSSINIPIYHELLDKFNSYSDTIVINQFLYIDRELSVYDIKNLSLYDKSYKTLKQKLNTLTSISNKLVNEKTELFNHDILINLTSKLIFIGY